MGPIGFPETVFIVVLALLLFGPKKLPELGRMLGKAITEFRRASTELKSTFDREMQNLERETQSIKETTSAHFQDSYNYDYSSYDTGTPYTPDAQPAIASAADSTEVQQHLPQHSPQPTLSASAPEGAHLTATDTRPGLTVTPAPGNIANGSLTGEHVFHSEPGPVADLGHHDAA
jgi:TatA/E family protein of Tat protein translocase